MLSNIVATSHSFDFILIRYGKMTDMETTALKGKFTYNSQEEGTHHDTQDHNGSTRICQKEGERKGHKCLLRFLWKRQGRVNCLGLTRLNNFSGLWAVGLVPSCLRSGPGVT